VVKQKLNTETETHAIISSQNAATRKDITRNNNTVKKKAI